MGKSRQEILINLAVEIALSSPTDAELEDAARNIYLAQKPNHHASWEIASKHERNRDFWLNVARTTLNPFLSNRRIK